MPSTKTKREQKTTTKTKQNKTKTNTKNKNKTNKKHTAASVNSYVIMNMMKLLPVNHKMDYFLYTGLVYLHLCILPIVISVRM